MGQINDSGYGVFRDGKQGAAHRWAYRTEVGPVPTGMFVCHKCDNPPCVRPDHLFLGTPNDNVQDRERKGRGAETPLGEKNPRAVLTEAQVLDIRQRYQDGESQTRLSVTFGVHRNTIAAIVRGRIWSHLPLGMELSLLKELTRSEQMIARKAATKRARLADQP